MGSQSAGRRHRLVRPLKREVTNDQHTQTSSLLFVFTSSITNPLWSFYIPFLSMTQNGVYLLSSCVLALFCWPLTPRRRLHCPLCEKPERHCPNHRELLRLPLFPFAFSIIDRLV